MKSIGALAVVTVALTTAPAWAQQAGATLDATTAGRFAALTLACVQKEYPNKITHILNSPDDVRAPDELTPAFYGCFDWHSSVHGHWVLARLVREFPKAAFVTDAVAALKPLEGVVVAQLKAWLPKLAYPIREGEHAQTAFAFGLIAAAQTHAASGLAAVTGDHYAGGHWLGSFATYLTTRRGIVPP